MFSFLLKKSRAAQTLRTDVHSHLLPGVDDGAKSREESLATLNELALLGFEKLILTPHIYPGVYPNTEGQLQEKFINFQQEASLHTSIQLELAAEYFMDESLLVKLKEGEPLLSFGKERFVLFETAFSSRPYVWDEIVFLMAASGYTPVLAHPERYDYVLENPSVVFGYREKGIRLQVNAPSLAGFYGTAIKNVAKFMIKNQLVDFLGSDTHKIAHAKAMKRVMKSSLYKRAVTLPLLNNQL